MSGNDAATKLVVRLLPEIIRADREACKRAEENVRQLMAPYQPERLIDRLAYRLLVAVVEGQKNAAGKERDSQK